MNRREKLLLALLRLGFGHCAESEQDNALFDQVSAGEWSDCYSMACKQGVMALAWDGVLKLQKGKQPPLNVKIPWAMAVERYEKRYAEFCKAIEELSTLYRNNGIATVQLKGVGLSSCYPVPQHREGGDIDIYTFALENMEPAGAPSGKRPVNPPASACGSGLAVEQRDRQANDLADELMRRAGIEVENHSYKHSNFNYKGIPIENHKCFLNVKHYKYGAYLDNFLRREMEPEKVVLQGCSSAVLVPSLKFNSVFIPFHAFQHYGCGLTLHHLCDWAVLVRRGALEKWPQEVDDKDFLTGIAAFSILSDALLGTDSHMHEKWCAIRSGIVEMNRARELACKMLKEMLSPEFENEIPVNGKVQILVYKTRRLLHRYRLINEVIKTSLLSNLWKSVVVHVKNPLLIFKTR